MTAPLLSSCGCCEGVHPLTPAGTENLPGLSALAYRVGTHARFKATMQAALARFGNLARLTTREDDDPSIALLDVWATVADVLTFYQERIANEGYLRTATERLIDLGAGASDRLRAEPRGCGKYLPCLYP